MRAKTSGGGGSAPRPTPPWLAGAAIGLAIIGLASGAIAVGAGIALGQSTWRGS